MTRRVLLGLVVVAGVLIPAAAASAHAQFLEADPRPGAKLSAAPDELRISYSEPPISARQVSVEDGCGNDVVGSADVEEKDVVADLAPGQPGKWKVTSRVVSAVDGHPTEKDFSFSVSGNADCEDADAAPPPTDDGGSSSMPIVLVLGGATIVLVAGAFFLRKRS